MAENKQTLTERQTEIPLVEGKKINILVGSLLITVQVEEKGGRGGARHERRNEKVCGRGDERVRGREGEDEMGGDAGREEGKVGKKR